MRLPEMLFVARALGEFGRATRKGAAGQRPMPEDVAHAIAEALPERGDLLVGRATMRTGIAAVLDQGNPGAGRAKHVVVCGIDRAVEPAGNLHLRHDKIDR
jgi:hypothetical protein